VTVPYAPEFRDLSDNAALLAEVARETGGRVLPADPAGVDVFSRADLKFPETPLPLTKALLLVWVGLFLVDVAVRRLAVDFRAMAGRVAAVVRKPFLSRASREEASLARLRARSEQVRRQIKPKAVDAKAARRFEAPAGAKAEMPDAAGATPAPPPPPKPAAPPAEKPPATPAADSLERLLDARRRRREKS